MASVTINGGTIFAEGTSVGAYPRSAWGVEGVTGAPTGSAVSTASITGGTLTFTGLTENAEYIAYAASPDRYKRFTAVTVQTPGIELGYAEITSTFTAAGATATDVPGLSIAIVEPARPYVVKAFTYGLGGNTINLYSFIQIVDAGSSAVVALAENFINTANTGKQVTAEARISTPATSGSSRTFKVQTLATGANVPSVTAAATGKAFIQAVTL